MADTIEFEPLLAATQIHSSLLSISVGAVLLPAAFHFALTYSKDDADDLSLQQQKDDILRMSHGVCGYNYKLLTTSLN